MSSKSKLLLGTAVAMVLSASSAMAADLYVPPSAAAPAPVVSTNWDGPYLGASVGYGWGTADLTYNGGNVFDTSSPSGFLIGAQAGYNFHVSDPIVLGIEGNIDWVNESGTFANNAPDNLRVNWEGSIRARLGFDAGSFLPYVEAGVAFANADESYSSTNNTYTGWTAGAGVEFALADNWTANVEYRYSDYGSQAIDATNSIHLRDSTIRVGINYHF